MIYQEQAEDHGRKPVSVYFVSKNDGSHYFSEGKSLDSLYCIQYTNV